MNKKLKIIVLGLLFLFPLIGMAQLNPINDTSGSLPSGNEPLDILILKYIGIALRVVGVLVVLFLIFGGFRYITSAGNEEAATSGKKIITNAIIGLVIIIFSFVIVNVIINALARRYV